VAAIQLLRDFFTQHEPLGSMLLLVLLVGVVVKDRRHQHLLRLCLQLFLTQLVLQILGRIGFVEVSQEALEPLRSMSSIRIPDIFEFVLELFDVVLPLSLPDCLFVQNAFILVPLQRLRARLVPACTTTTTTITTTCHSPPGVQRQCSQIPALAT